jgi:5-methyltetrahydrofolate--homocysteine methyltransferase
MESRLFERLRHGVLVCDGAMGTMLQAAGLPAGHPGELWNVEQPQNAEAIHRAYLEAGSDIVLTNTFGASPLRLAEGGLATRTAELNIAAVRAARRAADDFGAMVFGDIGPSAQLMEPYGEVSEETMYSSFLAQAQALASARVDAIIVETMTALDEMIVAIRAARNASMETPIVASFSFKKSSGGYRTMMGETVAQCVEGASSAGASIIGTNCGMGIDEMIEVVREIRASTYKPIIAQPNAGLPEVAGGKLTYHQTPEMMVEKVPLLIQAGATIVGGCCGTGPNYIRLLKNRIQAPTR